LQNIVVIVAKGCHSEYGEHVELWEDGKCGDYGKRSVVVTGECGEHQRV
jgi:hypothetical protein